MNVLTKINPLGPYRNQPGMFCWVKDANSRYLDVNPLYASYAGFSSPQQMIGKTDHQTTWHDKANDWIIGDRFLVTNYQDYLDRLARSDENPRTVSIHSIIHKNECNETDIFTLSTNGPPEEVPIRCEEYALELPNGSIVVWGKGYISTDTLIIPTAPFSARVKIVDDYVQLVPPYKSATLSRYECLILSAIRLSGSTKEAVNYLDDLYTIKMTTRQILAVKNRVYEKMMRCIEFKTQSGNFQLCDLMFELSSMGLFDVLTSSNGFLANEHFTMGGQHD